MAENYNHSKYENDPKVKAVFDKVLGGKRGVEIEIEVEGATKSTRTIPVPLGLLLPLLWRSFYVMFKRKKKEEDRKAKDIADRIKAEEAKKAQYEKSSVEFAKKYPGDQAFMDWEMRMAGMPMMPDDRIFSNTFVEAKHMGEKREFRYGDDDIPVEKMNPLTMENVLLQKEIGFRMLNRGAISRGVDYVEYGEDAKDRYMEILFDKISKKSIDDIFEKIETGEAKEQGYTKEAFDNIDLANTKNRPIFTKDIGKKIINAMNKSMLIYANSIPKKERKRILKDGSLQTAELNMIMNAELGGNRIDARIAGASEEQSKMSEIKKMLENSTGKNFDEEESRKKNLKDLFIPKLTIADLKKDLYSLLSEQFTSFVQRYIGPNMEYIAPEKMKEFREELITKMLQMWDTHDRSFDEDPYAPASKTDKEVGANPKDKGTLHAFHESKKMLGDLEILNTARNYRHNRKMPNPDLKEISIYQDKFKTRWSEIMVDKIMYPVMLDTMKSENYYHADTSNKLRRLAQKVMDANVRNE